MIRLTVEEMNLLSIYHEGSFSSLITTTELPVCQKRAKEKRCNLQRLQRFLNLI